MQMQKRLSSNATWNQSFPSELDKEVESALFARRFISMTSSFILDKRGIFVNQDDSFFKTRTIERLLIPYFNKDHPKAKSLQDKIDALKEGIQKKYLREFAIVFYKKPDEEDIIEVFSIRLMYGDEGDISLSLSSGIGSEEFAQNLFKATFTDLATTQNDFYNMVRILHRSIKHLDNLPLDSDASFRVSFTEDTPEDYMVPGYDASDKFYKINEATTETHINVMCGGHHKLQLLAASRLWKNGVDLNQTITSINQSIIAQAKKTKTTKGSQKKTTRVVTRTPYGKAAPLNKRETETPPA